MGKTILGQRIQELRKSHDLTQSQLAAKIGISMAAVRNYENGLREPNSKAMAALEEYFNVSGAYLRGETDKRETLSDEEQDQLIVQQSKEDLSDFLKRIQTAIKSVSDEELEFTDGLLIDFFWTLRKKNYKARSSTLLLMHLSAHIATMFFDFYKNYSKTLPEEESIDKAAEIVLEYQKEALEYVKKNLMKEK